MARVLGNTDNFVELFDNLSGSKVQFKFRMPTTAEREHYSNESVQRVRNKTKFNLVPTREKFGMKILTGFRDGDFEIEREGQVKPISCDPKSPDFYPDWREVVVQYAPDLVQMLAAHVFEAPAEVVEKESPDEALGNASEKN